MNIPAAFFFQFCKGCEKWSFNNRKKLCKVCLAVFDTLGNFLVQLVDCNFVQLVKFFYRGGGGGVGGGCRELHEASAVQDVHKFSSLTNFTPPH